MSSSIQGASPATLADIDPRRPLVGYLLRHARDGHDGERRRRARDRAVAGAFALINRIRR